MKQFIGILLFAALLSGLSSCYNTSIPKPAELIEKDKFVKMMVDIYLVQGINPSITTKDTLKSYTQTDLYYSVLKKYSVADSVFIGSLIYYSSFPKEYEKMHTQIMSILNETQEQFNPKGEIQTEKK